MKTILALLVVAGGTLATPAFAALDAAQQKAGLDLAQKKNCLACHDVEKKLIGPAYKDVAAKYKGDKTAADKLATKVLKGGVGAWGQIPMPANPQVSEAEAKELVKWVLAQ